MRQKTKWTHALPWEAEIQWALQAKHWAAGQSLPWSLLLKLFHFVWIIYYLLELECGVWCPPLQMSALTAGLQSQCFPLSQCIFNDFWKWNSSSRRGRVRGTCSFMCISYDIALQPAGKSQAKDLNSKLKVSWSTRGDHMSTRWCSATSYAAVQLQGTSSLVGSCLR